MRLSGHLDKNTVHQIYPELRKALKECSSDVFEIDADEIESMDSAGAAMLLTLSRDAEKKHKRIILKNIKPSIENTLSLFKIGQDIFNSQDKKKEGLLFRLGSAIDEILSSVKQFIILISDTIFLAIVSPFKKKGVRFHAFLEQAVLLGSQALPIVGLISFIVGLTLALQSAYQLQQFGANIFVVNLLGITMTREMGPLMTAIIVAGRSGSSIAAEIATMVVTEEVDALKAMGINPVRYVVVPKFYAITITMPLLTIMASAFGILGGFVIAVTYLDLNAELFLKQLINALKLKDIITGLIKSVAFAWIIVMVGAYKGFSVHGGAEGVGRSTTASVVTGIFMVIVADCIFSMVFYLHW